jgi:hypothetical protein
MVSTAVQGRLDRLGVVEHAVVGALRHGQDLGLHRLRVHALEQRVLGDLAADRLLLNSLSGIGPMMP